MDQTTQALWSSMDMVITPTASSPTYATALANLQYTFQLHYKKRLPFGLYQHPSQVINLIPS